MEQFSRNLDVNQMLKHYSKSPYNIKSYDDLLQRLEVMPESSQRAFKAKWGLDGQCGCASLEELADKLEIDDAYKIYKKAERDFAKAKFVLYLEDFKSIDFELAIKIGKLVRSYYYNYFYYYFYQHQPKSSQGSSLIGTVNAQRLLESIQQLEDKYKTVLIYHYGLDGNEPMNFKAIAQRFNESTECVRKLECKALRMLKIEHCSFSKLKTYTCELDLLLFENKISKRTYYALRRNNIDTVKKMKKFSEEQLLSMKGVGSKTCEEILELQRTL